MCIIAFPLILIAIVLGMKLLAQTQKENLGNMYKYIAMFVVAMGFLGLLCMGACCIMRHCCHRGERGEMRERCMMMHEDGCYEGHMGCGHMMGCDRHMMGGCNEMMNGGNMEGGNCKEGSECHEGGMGACKEGGDMKSCPMMSGGHCEEKDSIVVKKEIKK